MIAVAALLMAGAIIVWWGAPPTLLLDRLGVHSDVGRSPRRRQGSERVVAALLRLRLRHLAPAIAVAIPVGLVVGGVNGMLVSLLAVEAVGVAVRSAHGRSARKVAMRRDAEWQEACEIVATELRGGRTAEQAIATASAACADLVPVVRTMQLGGDVVGALRAVPGSPAAVGLAAAWATAHASGAGLAGVVERVTGELTEQLALRREIGAELAAPRATARLLALLPLGGMALGAFLGVDPLTMLLGTTTGLVCLSVGSVLAVTGVLWVDRLARAAEAVG